MEFFIDGVTVKSDFDMSEQEAKNYVDYINSHVKSQILTIEVKLCSDGKVDLSYSARENFERIRRITGYLSGTLDTWNNAKRAEERERVKHGIQDFS